MAHVSPWVIGAVAGGALLLLYVWQMTLLSTMSYERGALERHSADLQERLAAVRVAVLDQQSLTRVEERVREMQFVPETNAQYVTQAELARTLSRR